MELRTLIKKCPITHWTVVGKDNRPDYASKEETRKPGTKPIFLGTPVKNGGDRKSLTARDLRNMTDD